MIPEKILGWHFCPADMKLMDHGNNSRAEICVGKTNTVRGPLILCERGLHASESVLDALQYANSSMLCRVESSGQIARGDDKYCSTRRKVLAVRDIAPILHEFACHVAEDVLTKANITDAQPWAAIAAKRAWLRGEITDVELLAAGDAARDAARAVAQAARDAAWTATRYAAREAAWAAAGEAAEAARDAARDAAWNAAWAAAMDAHRGLLEEMVLAEFGIEGATK